MKIVYLLIYAVLIGNGNNNDRGGWFEQNHFSDFEILGDKQNQSLLGDSKNKTNRKYAAVAFLDERTEFRKTKEIWTPYFCFRGASFHEYTGKPMETL